MTNVFGTNQEDQNQEQAEIEVPVIEGYDADVAGDMIALQESMEDRQHVIEAIHSMDMAELEYIRDTRALKESGADEEAFNTRREEYEAVTEAAVGDAWEWIKKQLTNLWGKLQGFFRSAVQQVDALVRSSESFATKYEDAISKAGSAKYHGYKYSNLDNGSGIELKDIKYDGEIRLEEINSLLQGGDPAKIKAAIEKYKDPKAGDKIRGDIVGGGELTSDAYRSKLFGVYRSGAEKSEDKAEVSISSSDIISAMKNKTAKAIINEIETVIGKEFQTALKAINDAQKASVKSSGSATDTKHLAIELCRAASAGVSLKNSARLEALRAWRAAWSERDRAYKGAALAAIRGKKSGDDDKKPAASPEDDK